MNQLDLFSTEAPTPYDHNPLPPLPQPLPEKGEQLKRAGMARAAASKESQLGYARELAADIARTKPDRRITADDVAEALASEGREPLGPAAGSLFAVGPWTFTGDWIESTRANAHRNRLRVWRYDG